MALAADPSLPLQESVPSFDCEDGRWPAREGGSLPAQGLASRGKCIRRKKTFAGFVVIVALCGFLAAAGSCIQEAQCIEKLTNGFWSRLFSRLRFWRNFWGTTTTTTAPHQIMTTTPIPLISQGEEKLGPFEEHMLANLLFALASLAVVVFLTPFAEWSEEGTATQATQTESNAQTPKKPRLEAIDSLRFLLIAYIIFGHFIGFATENELIVRLIKQINVVVGGFFVISGYVASYVTTEVGERRYIASKLDDTVSFAVTKIMNFLPLHLLVLAIFGTMFVCVDVKFNGFFIAVWNGIISISLTQAWFPLSAEVWNAPTWFLSAFAFCLVVLPHALKNLAVMTKSQLRRTIGFLTIASIVPKLAYSSDLNSWGIFEGLLDAKTHPNYAFFNALRFSPLFASFEVFMGAAACRLVMLDTEADAAGTGLSAIPLVAMLLVIIMRAADVIAFNDMIVRGFLFIPLFISFLMRLHREIVGPVGAYQKLVMRFLSFRVFLSLGGISFPMFIVHGPIGQLFYKKAVAKVLWGGPLNQVVGQWFFLIYLAVVVASSYACQKFFVDNATVRKITADISSSITTAITGKVPKPPISGQTLSDNTHRDSVGSSQRGRPSASSVGGAPVSLSASAGFR